VGDFCLRGGGAVKKIGALGLPGTAVSGVLAARAGSGADGDSRPSFAASPSARNLSSGPPSVCPGGPAPKGECGNVLGGGGGGGAKVDCGKVAGGGCAKGDWVNADCGKASRTGATMRGVSFARALQHFSLAGGNLGV